MLTSGIATKRRRSVATEAASSCFFRTAAPEGERKALLQITERCNLHCAHCFVSSTTRGADMDMTAVADLVIPRLSDACVTRLTLTGGEPFVHPQVIEIVRFAHDAGMSVGICTNGTCITDEQIQTLAELGDVHVNVSFDGFRAESHGRFRGAPDSFEITVKTARRLAGAGLLQGFLSTPNALTTPDDYVDLATFGRALGAEYLLMNPLSAFGRGIKSRRRLAAAARDMDRILADVRSAIEPSELEVVPIRFPNRERALSGCIAGDIIYVFTHGEVAVCPYLVFAARSPQSVHRDSEFLVGNILEGAIAEKLDDYRFHERYTVGSNPTCGSCELQANCGKGCPAAVVAAGGHIGERDAEVCPLP